MLYKKILILILSCNYLNTITKTSIVKPTIKPTIEISIPKAGTNLFAKAITLISNKKICNLKEITNPKKNYNKFFFHEHLHYNLNNLNFIKKYNAQAFLIIRDPRDQIISLMFYIYKHTKFFHKLSHLEKGDLISKLIIQAQTLYENFLLWSKEPEVYTVKFENLIGLNGGGNQQKQIREISNIAQHIGTPISSEHTHYVIKNLFGGTPTFREGKIGSWKNHFTYEHKKLAKKYLGQLLVDLDYEKNLNW